MRARWFCGALLQSDWGRAFLKPTRFLSNLTGFASSLALGWPVISADGRYEGPLKGGQVREKLIGKDSDGFRTATAAAWPSPLCREIARCVWEAFGEDNRAEARALGVRSPRSGSDVASLTLSTSTSMETTLKKANG